MKIAICDDEALFLDSLKRNIQLNFGTVFDTIDIFHSGTELLKYTQEYNVIYDFFILDVLIPDKNGIQIGSTLRSMPDHSNSIIIFLTSYDAKIEDIVDIHPYAYVKKDNDMHVLNQKIDTAIRKYSKKDYILNISNSKNSLNINPNDIYYIKSSYRIAYFYLTTGNTSFNITSSELAYYLKNQHFLGRVSKSYYVNFKYIYKSAPTEIIIDNKEKTVIQLTRTYKNEFLNKYSRYVHGY